MDDMDFVLASALGTLSTAAQSVHEAMSALNGAMHNLHHVLEQLEPEVVYDGDDDGGVHFHPDFPD